MPKNLDELIDMISKRDGISWNEAKIAIDEVQQEMQDAFMNGSLEEVEDILRLELGLEPDYFELFIW